MEKLHAKCRGSRCRSLTPRENGRVYFILFFPLCTYIFPAPFQSRSVPLCPKYRAFLVDKDSLTQTQCSARHSGCPVSAPCRDARPPVASAMSVVAVRALDPRVAFRVPCVTVGYSLRSLYSGTASRPPSCVTPSSLQSTGQLFCRMSLCLACPLLSRDRTQAVRFGREPTAARLWALGVSYQEAHDTRLARSWRCCL